MSKLRRNSDKEASANPGVGRRAVAVALAAEKFARPWFGRHIDSDPLLARALPWREPGLSRCLSCPAGWGLLWQQGKGNMFRYSLVVLLGLCATAPVSASWADSLFDELSRDFGSVPRGPTLTHPFRLVNKTGGHVHIASVRVPV